jgi:hypothetical protein
MQKGCEKCEYTGFAYGTIPCMCTEEQTPVPGGQAVTEDHIGKYFDSTYGPVHINGVPVDYDIDNQFKPDPIDEDTVMVHKPSQPGLTIDFPVFNGKIEYNFDINKYKIFSAGEKKEIQIGDLVRYKNGMILGRALCSAKMGELVNVLIDRGIYGIDSSDPQLEFDDKLKRCSKCGHEV